METAPGEVTPLKRGRCMAKAWLLRELNVTAVSMYSPKAKGAHAIS